MFRLTRTSAFAVVTAAALLAMAAVPVAGADNARVRVLHASPDAPAVDIFVDGSKVDALTNVPFGTISDYLALPAGMHQVQVFPTGTSDTAVIDAMVDLTAGAGYTIAAIDPVASIKATVIQDDPMPTTDGTRVRVVHLSPDAPAVDVAPDGADPVVSNLAYPNASDYLALDGGTYDLEVRVAGTTDVALQLDPVMLASGRAYSVFAVGSAAAEPLGGNALQVVVAVDGMAAPATDTVGATEAPGMTGALLVLAGLVAIAAAFGLTRRFAVDRA